MDGKFPSRLGECGLLYNMVSVNIGKGADYSIADIAIFPWVRTHKAQEVELAKFPSVEPWYNALSERPAVKRGLEVGKALTDEAGKALFGQTA